MGIRGDIDESDRDLNRDMYPNRTRSNRFNFTDDRVDGELGAHPRAFYEKVHVLKKDGYGGRLDRDDYADFTPKDITGSGKNYFGKGPRNYIRKPERIADDIYHLFTKDKHLDASFIEIDVVGDEVHLEGFVDTRSMRWLAEDLAMEVPGVRVVINKLKLRYES
jgi:hypothetical protein